MKPREYKRKTKEAKPVVALCYDFDKTLTPDDMQAQGYIQAVGNVPQAFWEESNALARDNGMDNNLAYMYMMVKKARGKLIPTKESFAEFGAKIKLFPGVEEWFSRIREYGEQKGIIIEHYIISSGLREMIEGTKIARDGVFEEIYASAFHYDGDGVADWPVQAVNYTTKTQFLFRIEKGVLDVNDPAVNDYFPPETLRVPFRNIVYIGDSDTDIPCMKLVTVNGGHAIGVYHPEQGDRQKVYRMLRERRIRYFAPADYREGEELDRLVKAVIDKTATYEVLERIYEADKAEAAHTLPKRPGKAKKKKDNEG